MAGSEGDHVRTMVGRLGRYEPLGVLGTGGFATVYQAMDPSLQAIVAVKVLADNWSRDPDVRRRFRAEAVLLRRVQAEGSVPGLIEVYDIDETDSGQPYFVMGYADQGTLADRCHAQRWSPADVVPVIDALAATVGALHDNQVIHRDLKPTNLLLRTDGRAATAGPGRLVGRNERLLVADLGLARDLRREGTSLSFAGGTRRYVAPEQLDARALVDQRADVHAASVLIGDLLDVRDGSDPAGCALRTALAQGTALAPEARFDSMDSWRRALLDAIAADSSTLDRIVVDTGSVDTTNHHRRSGRGRWLVLAAAGLVALSGVGVVLTGLGGASDIAGPDRIVVGETARYRAPAHQDRPVVWTGPNGEAVRDEDLEVQAVIPGELRIELMVDGERTRRTIRAVASPDGPTVAGPVRVRVGETAVLRPRASAGADDYYWLDPDGVRVDEGTLRIEATRVGRLSVALVARDGDGIERGVRHHIEVVS